jgi:hypothetical protein
MAGETRVLETGTPGAAPHPPLCDGRSSTRRRSSAVNDGRGARRGLVFGSLIHLIDRRDAR